MNCRKVRANLPGYLDGTLSSSASADEHARVSSHVETCATCQAELDRYRRLSALMSRTAGAAPPADLALRIRVAVAQGRESRAWAGRVRALGSRLNLLLENMLRPLALPATAGFVSAILVFVVVLQMIAPGMALTIPNDVPINLMREASVESLASLPVTPSQGGNEAVTFGQHGLLVDVTVDQQGHMVNYQILAGPDGPAVRRQLDQILLISRFHPQMSFGRPTAGGHVVLSFNEVRVRG
jgi:anti-sigma factor RsiW